MQNVFPPLLNVQQTQSKPQQPQMTSQLEQDVPPSLDIQLLMSTLEGQQQQGSSNVNSNYSQLFEIIFNHALTSNQNQQNNIQLASSDQAQPNNGQCEQLSPPITLAEDTSTVVSTPTSAVAPASIQPTEEEAAKLMTQLLKEGSASFLQQLPGQSQPTSPNIHEASAALIEQLKFLGMLSGNNDGASDQLTEWKNAMVNGTLDFSAILGSQAMNPMNSSGQTNQQQQRSASNDAYCDICNKHLCNRYFLRTHRYKKHKICDLPLSGSTSTATSSLQQLQNVQSPLKRDGDWPNMEFSTPNRLQEQDVSISQSADPPAKMPRLAPISNQTSKEEQQSPLKSPALSLNNPQMISRFNCETCDKDFDSIANLLQHQMHHHQVQTSNFAALLMHPPAHGAPNNGNQTPISSPSGHQTPQQQTPTSQQHTPSANNMLSQLLPNIQLSTPFQIPQLFNFGNLPPNFPFSNAVDIDLNRMTQQIASNAARASNAPTVQTQKTPKRQYTSTSRNFCDLCQKEVCNKYFLRTHMLKMHNIIIDENKSVIANIDTLEKEKEGNLSFRCDYCKIKFDTRQQLRDHKREVHNIAPTSINTTNGVATVSSASSECDASSKTPNSASAPLGNFFTNTQQLAVNGDALAHHDQMNPSSSASSTAGTAGSSQANCNYCPESFIDHEKLSLHLLSAHSQEFLTILAKSQLGIQDMNEDELVNQVALKFAQSNQMEKAKENKDAIYKCSHCEREYTNAAKFNDHLQLHITAKKFSPKKNKRKVFTPQKIKKFKQSFTCIKCERRFSNRLECQNHIMVHLQEQKLSSQNLQAEEHQTELKKGNSDEIDEEMLNAYIHEDEEESRCTAVDEVVEQAHQAYQKRSVNKEEKHSHTSGSASPSSTHHLTEGFFQPFNTADKAESQKYLSQSFIMRVADTEQDDVSHNVCEQLLGTLPMRQTINQPFRLTFDLQPLPDENGVVKSESRVEEEEDEDDAKI